MLMGKLKLGFFLCKLVGVRLMIMCCMGKVKFVFFNVVLICFLDFCIVVFGSFIMAIVGSLVEMFIFILILMVLMFNREVF